MSPTRKPDPAARPRGIDSREGLLQNVPMNLNKILLALVVLLLLAGGGAAGYLYVSLNTLVKKVVESAGPSITGTTVTLDSANLSPFSGNGSLNGLTVGNPKGYSSDYSLKLGHIAVSVEKQSLLRNPVVVNSIEIREPQLCLIGTPGGTNLQQIMRNIKSAGSTKAKTGNPSPVATRSEKTTEKKTFLVKSVVISGTKLEIVLSAFGQSVHQSLDLPEIRLHNLGSDGSGLTPAQLSEEILTPLINAGIDEGIKAASKQGLLQLQQNGGKEIGNFLKGLFK